MIIIVCVAGEQHEQPDPQAGQPGPGLQGGEGAQAHLQSAGARPGGQGEAAAGAGRQ